MTSFRKRIPKLGSLFVAAMVVAGLRPAAIGQDAKAQEQSPTPEAIQFFESKIRPVLVDQCYRCHSNDGLGTRGGLAVDSRDALLAGGESGPAVVPGDLQESVLWKAINYEELKMPPKGRLPKEVLADFKKWIEMGAPDPRVATAAIVRSQVTAEDIAKGKEFWSFKAPVKPVVEEDSTNWAKTDIDRLVAVKHREHELQPAADADANTLLRRLCFDLIGLPPTVEEAEAFEVNYKKDPNGAVANIVDRLLEKPQFGERWGRYWLDVARYAESTGKEVDMTFPNAWRYRDYVIDSFNRDKPYDQFIREQIAGDLLPAKEDRTWAEQLVATGFLAIGPKALIEQNPRQFRADLIDEQIDTTTRVILGMSVACARCHDHKFDPIPQTDYYAMAGIFQSTETFFGGTRSQRNRQPSNQIILPIDDPNPGVKSMSSSEVASLKKQLQEREAEYVEARRAQRQPNGDAKKGFLSLAVLDQAISHLQNQIHSVDEKGKPLSFCMGVQDSERIRNATVLVRGEIDQPAQEVDRGFVQVLSNGTANFGKKSSGRLELAKWLTDRNNPLTARVMVNRVWQHLFGNGIVREPENFGVSGPAPSNPELLDYLAVQFMEKKWSVKSLVREIVNSRTYRLSSQFDSHRFEADPDNLYVARGNPRRLDAEAIRDSILAISGQLDLKRPKASLIASYGTTLLGPNGPPVPLSALQSLGEMAKSGRLEKGKVPSLSALQDLRNLRPSGANPFDASVYYRSVYLPIARNTLPRSLDVFDFAEPSLVVGLREESNTADQALYMLNNPFILEQSEAIARRLIKMADSPAERINKAFLMIYGRAPTSSELRASQEYIRKMSSTPTSRPREERGFAMLSQFCQALLSSAEFRYVN